MRIQEHKPEGVFTRILTPKELQKLANEGNDEAKKELIKKETPTTIEERLNRLERLGGLI